MTHFNGDEYEGNYSNNKKEGFGIMKYNNGDEYQGNWKDNLRDGKGFVVKKNGDIFKGYWQYDNLKEGTIKFCTDLPSGASNVSRLIMF